MLLSILVTVIMSSTVVKSQEHFPLVNASVELSKCGACPSGYEAFDNYCYKLFPIVGSTFDSAENTCRQSTVTGHLASILSPTENKFIFDMGVKANGTTIYLGAQNTGTVKGYKWIDGQPFRYTDWEHISGGRYQPDGDGRYVHLWLPRSRRTGWNDYVWGGPGLGSPVFFACKFDACSTNPPLPITTTQKPSPTQSPTPPPPTKCPPPTQCPTPPPPTTCPPPPPPTTCPPPPPPPPTTCPPPPPPATCPPPPPPPTQCPTPPPPTTCPPPPPPTTCPPPPPPTTCDTSLYRSISKLFSIVKKMKRQRNCCSED